MHGRWIQAGGDPDRFWRLTPGEMDREARAMIARLKSEREFRAWEVWTNAQLGRVDAKKFPELPDFLAAARGETKRQQTPEEMAAIARQWASVVNRT